MKILYTGLSAAALLTSQTVWAATPEQVGDYAGTIKTKILSETGIKTSTKSEVLFSLAADDSTTLTIAGTLVDSGAVVDEDDNEIFLQYIPTPAGSIGFAALHFKKTTIKGSVTGYIVGPPFEVFSSKLSLKKVNP